MLIDHVSGSTIYYLVRFVFQISDHVMFSWKIFISYANNMQVHKTRFEANYSLE